MSSKKWIMIFFSILLILALITAIIIYTVDPYFHYREPKSFFGYNLENERYINNGILKNFDYDAIITGTSLDENFKTSEFDSLFNYKSIKVPLSGAEYKELADQMKIAIKSNANLKCILYGIKSEDLLNDKDRDDYGEYPTYLYDDNIFNDYRYILSGQALIKVFKDFSLSLIGKNKSSFDEYVNWNDEYVFSKEKVLSNYKRITDKKESTNLTEEEKNTIIGNINQNLIDIIKENKNITFLLFIAPNSILGWDKISQNGQILKYLQAEEILVKSLIEFNNVKFYSFNNNYDLVCNLDNYKDFEHYSEDINSQILHWIKEDKYLLTKENVEEYLKKEKEFYINYDYNSIFENLPK